MTKLWTIVPGRTASGRVIAKEVCKLSPARKQPIDNPLTAMSSSIGSSYLFKQVPVLSAWLLLPGFSSSEVAGINIRIRKGVKVKAEIGIRKLQMEKSLLYSTSLHSKYNIYHASKERINYLGTQIQ